MSRSIECSNGVCKVINAPRKDLHSSRIRKVTLLVLALASALAMLDLSVSRLRYHFLLRSSVSPVKTQVQADIYNYHGEIPQELQGCQAFDREVNAYVHNCALSACEQNAVMLSEKRQEILHSVRAAHPTSRWVSELFDEARGMDQLRKIERLFARKSCEGVISSSDKTNMYMDLCAIGTLILSLFIFFRTVRNFAPRVKLD